MKMIFAAVLGVLLTLSAVAEGPLVYVIPIRDDIEQTMVYLVRRGVKEALDQKASALVLHIETNGGRVDCTEEIIKALDQFTPRENTFTFIDKKALSAGAFISSATKHIYMAPGSVIGAATPVLAAPGGQGPQEISKSYEEKISSALRAMVRANAERNGHFPEVFAAMVDRDQGLTLMGKEIVPKGKILTLTTNEAEQKIGSKPLLSSGTVETLELMVKRAGGEKARRVTLEPTGFEKTARFITMIAPFLLTAGMILGYLEFKTSGFGLLGILAGVCFFVYFFGHYVAGLSGYEPLLIFLAGLILIALEIYFLPGLILPALTGLVLVLLAIAFSMIDFYPNQGLIPSWSAWEEPLVKLIESCLLAMVGGFVLGRVLPSSWFYEGLTTATVAGPSLPKGILVSIGTKGIATTDLRPAGTADFEGIRHDVVTTGGWVSAGAEVVVAEVEGIRIVVEPISHS